jgi:hypothetical protein
MSAKMYNSIIVQEMLKPINDTSNIQFPPRFSDAMCEIRATIKRCDENSIPRDTFLAALLTELMPALVDAYGPKKVSFILEQLAYEISNPSAI